jgi:transposase
MAGSGVTAGVDWATEDHAVAVVDHTGRQTQRFTVASTVAGLRELVRRLRASGVVEVAIERPDGVVVGALLEAGFTVVVISPNQIKSLRSRYGSAGNKDDRFDAFVLADTLRTDRARLRPLTPDTDATVALRAAVRARKDLVIHRVSLCNQLREHLRNFYPGPVGLFHELDGEMSLRFLSRFDCQERADWLSGKRLAAFLKGVRYSGHTTGEVLHTRLTAAPRGATSARRARTSPAPSSRRCAGWWPRSRCCPRSSGNSWPRTSTGTSSPACRAREPCARPGCWPRSATPVADSLPLRPWRVWPGWPPRPVSPGN